MTGGTFKYNLLFIVNTKTARWQCEGEFLHTAKFNVGDTLFTDDFDALVLSEVQWKIDPVEHYPLAYLTVEEFSTQWVDDTEIANLIRGDLFTEVTTFPRNTKDQPCEQS